MKLKKNHSKKEFYICLSPIHKNKKETFVLLNDKQLISHRKKCMPGDTKSHLKVDYSDPSTLDLKNIFKEIETNGFYDKQYHSVYPIKNLKFNDKQKMTPDMIARC